MRGRAGHRTSITAPRAICLEGSERRPKAVSLGDCKALSAASGVRAAALATSRAECQGGGR